MFEHPSKIYALGYNENVIIGLLSKVTRFNFQLEISRMAKIVNHGHYMQKI